jgi:anti-sigma factor RsiW
MMNHPTELELVEWTAGRLEPERARAVHAHVAVCETCARTAAAQRDTWDALGNWTVTPPACDLWPAVEAQLEGTSAPARAGRPSWLRTAVHAAAAILLAAAVGHVAGRWVRSRVGEPAVEVAFVESLHLEALAGESSVGLSTALQTLVPDDLKEDVR